MKRATVGHRLLSRGFKVLINTKGYRIDYPSSVWKILPSAYRKPIKKRALSIYGKELSF